jgi:hypothetical protein
MKAAVVAAREDGMAPAEVVEHAAAGRFDGLPPFTIAESTIRRLVAFKRNRDRVTAGNGGSDHDDDTPEPDRLRALAEKTIARVEQLANPSAQDLSAAQQAQRVLDDADRRERRGRPAKPVDPEPGTTPLLAHLLKLANDPQDDQGSDLETRRHELSRRWVFATVRQVRAQHPDWDQPKVVNADTGRPRRFESEWRTLCGHDPAGARDHVPPRASPEKVRQLAELLDREEAELAALEARHPAAEPGSAGV